MTWFFYSIIAVICFTAYDILSRKISIDSENPRALSVVYNATITLLTPLLFLLEPFESKQISIFIIGLTILNILAWGAFGRVEYYAHKYVEASVLGILTKLSPVIVLFLSLLFYGEILTSNKIVGIGLVILSNIYLIIVTEKSNIHFKKGLLYGILTAIFLGLGWTLDKAVSPYYGIALFSFISFSSPTILNALTPPMKLIELNREIKRVNFWKLVVLSFFNLIGYAALVKGLMIGEASKVTTISTASTPFVILISALILNERTNLKIKIICSLLTMVGIYLLR